VIAYACNTNYSGDGGRSDYQNLFTYVLTYLLIWTGIELRASDRLSMCSNTELYSQSRQWIWGVILDAQHLLLLQILLISFSVSSEVIRDEILTPCSLASRSKDFTALCIEYSTGIGNY
jgi:hypothetical protein